MKKVGIVGGMGPESTIPYYHDIVYGVQKKIGEDFFPNLTIESINVFKVLDYCEKQQYEELSNYLMVAINYLCKCDVDFIVLAANTPHIVYDKLVEKSPIPIVSIIEETAKEVERQRLKKVGLIGTKFTMKGDYYRKPFIRRKISVVTPNEVEMDYISEKIASELEHGIINEDTRAHLYAIMNRMRDEEAVDGVILGCTELPLIIDSSRSPVLCLDTMQIHINSIIQGILS